MTTSPEEDAPRRIQLRRTKGWNLQAISRAMNGLPAVNVARPSKWGNPYRVGEIHPYANAEELEDPVRVEELRIDAEDAVNLYNLAVCTGLMLSNGDPFAELRGKNLACYCGDGPCHADLLLELANKP